MDVISFLLPGRRRMVRIYCFGMLQPSALGVAEVVDYSVLSAWGKKE